MTPDRNDRSLANLVSDLIRQLSSLVQTEGKLLRSELRDSGDRLGAGVVEVLVGIGLLIPAMVILLESLVVLLSRTALGPGWSSAVVGFGVGLIGLMTLLHGRRTLSADGLAPRRSAEQLRKDASLVKEKTQ